MSWCCSYEILRRRYYTRHQVYPHSARIQLKPSATNPPLPSLVPKSKPTQAANILAKTGTPHISVFAVGDEQNKRLRLRLRSHWLKRKDLFLGTARKVSQIFYLFSLLGCIQDFCSARRYTWTIYLSATCIFPFHTIPHNVVSPARPLLGSGSLY